MYVKKTDFHQNNLEIRTFCYYIEKNAVFLENKVGRGISRATERHEKVAFELDEGRES